VLDRDGWQCTSCGKPVEGFDATVDHVTPYTGPESNAMHNLVTLCRSCNSTKQDRVIFRLDWVNRRWLSHV
jgi:5-methylcytosine-specific restriction endonuclease McrA